MCTVTFIPTRSGIYLTSNRDERPGRAPALYPGKTSCDQGHLLYPQDGEAGGSWIALKGSGDAAVLLNGAFKDHQRKSVYRQSRGLVFLEIAGAVDPVLSFSSALLEGIEPFTLILYTCGILFECRWDGLDRHIMRLDHQRLHIWSSATLYDEEAACIRKRLFEAWSRKHLYMDRESILEFHRSAGLGLPGMGLAVNSRGKVITVSITSIHIAGIRSSMYYTDLQTGQTYESGPGIVKKIPSWRAAVMKYFSDLLLRGGAMVKRSSIRLSGWEYWPFEVVYAPLFFYWIWLSWKARSFFFFSTANPSIINAGFVMESKRQIYDLLPEGSYPGTVHCPRGRSVAAIRQSLAERGLVFPLIAKPDIGQRGMQVSLLRNEGELYVYRFRSKVDFLLQEYIDYPYEAGIFYYRLPGEQKGRISGVVGKEMISVIGDGRSTVERLLQQNDRFVLQLPALRASEGDLLRQIPGYGEVRLLAPYGNHSRGAKFLDWSDRISPALERSMDSFCRQIPGFYFGRLDIKFKSWEALCEGRQFSVIELNGAGSEPTHIYDPRHSIFFAWKEIIRHWRLLFDISRANAVREGLVPMGTGEGLRMLRNHARHEKLIS